MIMMQIFNQYIKLKGRHFTTECICIIQENLSMKYIPHKPHFYIEKNGVCRGKPIHLYFLFLIQNIDCGYSLEPPDCVPTINVLSTNVKKI